MYAGFWRRLGAYCIDTFILSMTCFFFVFNIEYYTNTHCDYALFFALIMNWLYYCSMESSSHQATLGKMAFHIVVTDISLQRISFATASLRWLCKFFSLAIFGIGYIMIAFTKRKQALHDIMTNCLVILP